MRTKFAVVCSGTATLEIAKRNIPQLVIYKFNFFTSAIASLLINVKYANLINILRAMSITAVIASGVTLSLVVGGFDLSVGSVASMSMAVVISMFIWFDQNVFFGLIAALAVGAAIGLFNSFFIITIKSLIYFVSSSRLS